MRMTLPSQFSLEEENFYKDIQDLVKNESQNEKELSSFLQRYMGLLAKAGLDDETFIINFTKAGLIIEASAKVYGTKVDKLWINLEHVLESLKNRNPGQSKKKLDCDDGDEFDVEEGCDNEVKRKLSHSRRRRKAGDTLFSADDFLEIDNVSGLLGKNMNESSNNKGSKLKLCEKVPNMFIKNKRKKNKIDVCLNKCSDDKDVIRLRDWVISTDCLLVKEIYTPRSENLVNNSKAPGEDITKDGHCNEEPMESDAESIQERLDESFKNEKNNNTETAVELQQNIAKSISGEKITDLEEVNDFMNELNVSRESELAKFPNILNRLSEDCLVDVDEVFWSSSKFEDVIPIKKMRAGKTNKPLCQLCADKKVHKKREKKCIEEKKFESLNSFFDPHVQPTVTEPQFGILPDEELYIAFKVEMKLIEQLGKTNGYRNIYEALHPEENPEELKDFLGFDKFDHYLMKKTLALQNGEMEENLRLENEEDDNENYAEDPPPDNEFELPFPVTENTVRTSIVLRANEPGSKADEPFANSESEYQKLVIEELKDHYAAKTSFAKNKELGMKISKWHEMIADKIKTSQQREALNMNLLARKIMDAFSSSPDSSKPTMPFRELVKKHTQRDIPRYFFACLQLTNEGNLNISRSNPQLLVTDCMVITLLRSTRVNYELDESTAKSPYKEKKSSQISRKRSSSKSPSILDDNNSVNKNKKVKQKTVRTQKRQKNFNLVQNSKKRKCSVSSSDSLLSN